MKLRNSEVLVSGASVAGPTLVYWLRWHGFTPTVVERTPALRAGLGGHAVDLFGPAVEVAEWTGILPEVLAARTQTELLVLERPGRAPVEVRPGGAAAAAARAVRRAGLGAAPHAVGAGRRPGLLLRLDQPDPDAELVERPGDPGRRAGYSPRRARRWAGDGLGGRGSVRARGELRAAGGDHTVAFSGYERAMGELVRRSRGSGPTVMRSLIPGTSRQVWMTIQAPRLVPRLPAALQRRLSALQARPARALAAVDLRRYQAFGGRGA